VSAKPQGVDDKAGTRRLNPAAHAGNSLRLDRATPGQLVDALAHNNMWVRLTAQRLLVERGQTTDLKHVLQTRHLSYLDRLLKGADRNVQKARIHCSRFPRASMPALPLCINGQTLFGFGAGTAMSQPH